MKKFIAVLAVVALTSFVAANAQPRSIGARIGYGVEVAYQHGLGDNMVSLDAGLLGFHGIEAVATYDWINPFNTQIPWDYSGTWNWSLGVGAGAAWSWWGYASVGVAGRVGVEYNFEFPLQLSIDWRPVIGPGFYYGYGTHGVGFNLGGLYAGGIALGVRYNF